MARLLVSGHQPLASTLDKVLAKLQASIRQKVEAGPGSRRSPGPGVTCVTCVRCGEDTCPAGAPPRGGGHSTAAPLRGEEQIYPTLDF